MSTTLSGSTSTMAGDFELIAAGTLFADRYAIEERLGAGALSIVYSALDMFASPPRRVALKVARKTPSAKTSLSHEAIVLAKIHELGIVQGVVQIVELPVQQRDGLSYLVLEHIEGQTLRHTRRSLVEVCRVGKMLARILASLHAAGIVVADIKPDNIMLRDGNAPVFIDFGAAHLVHGPLEPTLLTPAYAAPEQLAGHPPTFASDMYALAMVLEEWADGWRPKRFVSIMSRCKAQNADERPTALELAHELGGLDVSRPKTPALWFVVGLIVLTIGLAGISAGRITAATAPETALSTHIPPPKFSMVSGLDRALFLAADESFVYWSRINDGTIQRVPIEGGPSETVARIDGRATQLAISGQTLYIRDGIGIWSFSQKELRRFANAAGDGDIVADARNVAWTNALTGEVLIKAVHGNAPVRILASKLSQPYDVAMDATHVYWANGDGTVMRVSRQGGEVDVLARGQSWPEGTLVDETHVYWLERHTGGVFRVSKQRGEPVQIARTEPGCRGTALDGRYVYWADPADRRIMRVPRSGGEQETLVSGPSGLYDLIVVRNAVYFSNSYGGDGVMRLQLPSP